MIYVPYYYGEPYLIEDGDDYYIDKCKLCHITFWSWVDCNVD